MKICHAAFVLFSLFLTPITAAAGEPGIQCVNGICSHECSKCVPLHPVAYMTYNVKTRDSHYIYYECQWRGGETIPDGWCNKAYIHFHDSYVYDPAPATPGGGGGGSWEWDGNDWYWVGVLAT